MRRSERKKRSPVRYSPPLTSSHLTPPQKSAIVARYMSKNMKSGSSAKSAGVKIVPVSEPTNASPPITNKGSDVLSKYSKSEKPSIAEIFGASPDSENMEIDPSHLEEIDVTGDGEATTSKELPSWIELGPMEGKAAPHQRKSSVASVLAKRFGVPEMGFADLLSESAGIPQSAFPIDGYSGIEGASHPDNKSGSKGLAPQKKKLIQQHLILLLHAYKCERYAVTKVPCPVPFCSVMKKVQAHMRVCTEGYYCVAPFCSSSRRIMCHWKHCKTPDCVVCSRLKCLAMHKRKKELEKLKAMGEIPPPDVNNAQGAAVVKQQSPNPLVVDESSLPIINNSS